MDSIAVMGDKTTITISRENWEWLNSRKEKPGESFDDVITRLRGEEPTDHSMPDELDLPGSGEALDERRKAISRMYEHLQEERSAEKNDLLEFVDPDVVEYNSKESFWSNCVKGRDSLRALPGVRPPPTGKTEWRYIPE